MKTKEQVIEWLKSQEWFEQFKANVEKYGIFKKIEEYLERFSGNSLFFCAFPWDNTSEGNHFWFEKCTEYITWWYNEND